jgi:four helix bundle protein
MESPGQSGFERLDVWQCARRFSAAIMPVSVTASDRHDFALSQQLNAATLSIMSNIAEGYMRRAPREFAYFVRVAEGSNAEARSCLYAALDRGYVTEAAFDELVDTSNRIGQMLTGLRRSVQRRV